MEYFYLNVPRYINDKRVIDLKHSLDIQYKNFKNCMNIDDIIKECRMYKSELKAMATFNSYQVDLINYIFDFIENYKQEQYL